MLKRTSKKSLSHSDPYFLNPISVPGQDCKGNGRPSGLGGGEVENLGSRGGGRRRHGSTNLQGLILSDNLRKAHRNSKEMIHFSSFWPRLKRLSSGAGQEQPGSCCSAVGRVNWGTELTVNMGLAGQRADVNFSHCVV